MREKILVGILSSMVFVSCNTPKESSAKKIVEVKKLDSKVIVYSIADDQARKEFSALKLDETHQNMLDPRVAKESFESAMESWKDIHTELNNYLMKEKFDWGIEDERIKIFNKIYFEANGAVKYYVYGVHSDVPQDRIAAFGKIAKEFFANQKIKLERDVDFAQCGKAFLMNSNI